MKREDLIRELSRQLDTPEHSCSVFLHAFFDVVKSMLRNGETVHLPHLGIWTPSMEPVSGKLTSVSFTSSSQTSTGEDHAVHGPASSIDSLHFIPADALETNGSETAPIDVSIIVGEVNRLFQSEDEAENGELDVDVPIRQRTRDLDIPTVPEFQEVLHEDDSPPPTWSEETAILRDEEELDPTQINDIPVSGDHDGPDDDVPDMLDLDDIPDPDPDETAQAGIEADEDVLYDDPRAADANDESGCDDESDAHDERYSGDDTIEESNAGEMKDDEQPGEDALDDAEVFYRNRDQLYNPPEERGSRGLLITAIVLTVCVLAIILFLVFSGKDEDPLRKSGRDTENTAQVL